MLSELGHRLRQTLVDPAATLADFGPRPVESAPTVKCAVGAGPNAVEFRPASVEVGPMLADSGQSLAHVGRSWPRNVIAR